MACCVQLSTDVLRSYLEAVERSFRAGSLRIRVTFDQLQAIEKAAKANGETISEFVRGKLIATVEV